MTKNRTPNKIPNANYKLNINTELKTQTTPIMHSHTWKLKTSKKIQTLEQRNLAEAQRMPKSSPFITKRNKRDLNQDDHIETQGGISGL